MEFSVYIIRDRDKNKTNEYLFNNLAGDMSVWSSLANEGVDLVSDITGVELTDRYANPDVVGNDGIVIRGDMISNVLIKKEITKREIFSGGFKSPFTNTPKATLMTTITVTGSLFAPALVYLQNTKSEKLKNMARVLAWASLPNKFNDDFDGKDTKNHGDIDDDDATQLSPSKQRTYKDDYNSYYYRRVLVTVYSSADMQFRAVLHDQVYVASYEETYTDQNGDGSFTLVMQTATPSIYDVIVEGPTYYVNYLSAADAVSTGVEKAADTAIEGIEMLDNALGFDGKLSDPFTKFLDMTKNATDLLANPDEWKDRIKPENFFDEIDQAVKNIRGLKKELPDLSKKVYERNNKKDLSTDDIIDKAADDKKKYDDAYNALTPEQKEVLKYIPGFDKMSLDDKLKYIDAVSKMTDLTDTGKSTATTTTKTVTINKADTTKTVTVTKTTGPNKSDATITISDPNKSDTAITITTKDMPKTTK